MTFNKNMDVNRTTLVNKRNTWIAAGFLMTAAASGVAQAVSLSGTTTVRITSQALEFVDVVPAHSGGVVLELGLEYTVGDVFTIAFDGDPELLHENVKTTITRAPTADLKGVTLSLISSGPHELVYRITDIQDATGAGAGTTVGVFISIQSVGDEPLEFSADSFVNSNSIARARARSQTSDGQELEPWTSFGAAIISVNSAQFEVEVDTALQSVIDVNADPVLTRFESRAVTNMGTTDSGDALTVALTDTTVGFQTSETANHELTTFTLAGDFSWLVDNDPDTEALELVSNNIFTTSDCVGTTDAADMEVTRESVTFICTAPASEIDFVIDVAQNGEERLPDGQFTLTAVTDYSDDGVLLDGIGGTVGDGSQTGTVTIATAIDAGKWGINGARVNVSYMPYRQDISQIINVTNRAADAGDVYVVAYPENSGDAIDLGVVAQASGNSVTRLAGPIIEALEDKTGTDHRSVNATTRYALEITTTAPSGDIEVYSAYNVGGTGARLVVNDSNGGE